MIEAWRKVWRDGLVPHLSTDGLRALRMAVVEDDPRLIQGVTTSPPPLQSLQEWPVEGACGLGYCGWQGEGLQTVAAVEEYFAQLCFEADQALGEPAACRWFLNWFDDTPRAEMRALLVAEIDLALATRPGGHVQPVDDPAAA